MTYYTCSSSCSLVLVVCAPAPGNLWIAQNPRFFRQSRPKLTLVAGSRRHSTLSTPQSHIYPAKTAKPNGRPAMDWRPGVISPHLTAPQGFGPPCQMMASFRGKIPMGDKGMGWDGMDGLGWRQYGSRSPSARCENHCIPPIRLTLGIAVVNKKT